MMTPELDEAIKETVASLPKCESKNASNSCENPATTRIGSKNIDLGWADQESPGWLTCDSHISNDPERSKEDLPQAKLIRLSREKP